MSRFTILFFELLLVVISVYIADFLQAQINFIPKSVIHLPSVDYPRSDFYTVLFYFSAIHALVFISASFISGVWQMTNAKRTMDEIFALIMAFTLSTLIIFVTTSVSFDPNFIVGIALVSGLIYVFLYFTLSIWTQQLAVFESLLKALGSRAFSFVGIAILVFAMAPGVFAKLFTSDRDFANQITQIRIYFNQNDDAQYALVNAFDDTLFAQPILVKQAPNDRTRLYVLERSGRLISMSYPAGGDIKVELDINNRVGEFEIENGALGFAFHPKFNISGSQAKYIYIYYTEVNLGQQTNRLSRFNLAVHAQDRANTEVTLLALPRETSGFHNGGSVEFDSEGYLYLAVGEGVHPKGEISPKKVLRGGILRIDVDCNKGSLPISGMLFKGDRINYCIPADNPFIKGEVLPEYWALGLRNPYRFVFDKNGELWLGDVGSTKWEEVNRVVKGGNYQFPFVEGYESTGIKKRSDAIGKEHPPVYTYIHTAYDRAVIGGFIYHGDEFSALQGKYVFADNYSSKIFTMRADLDRVDNVITIARASQFAQRGVSSIVQLENGDVLVTTLGRSAVASGEVLKLVDKDKVHIKQQTKVAQITVSAGEAMSTFSANCVRCHGASGKGDGLDVEALGVTIADFSASDFLATKSDQFLYDAIEKGGYAVGLSPMMPQWKGILSEAEISALVDVIKSMSEKDK